MIWNRISESLQNKGFLPSAKNSKIAEFLIRVTEDKRMYICSIIKNIGGAGVSAEMIVESATQLERKFLLNGYEDVSVMHIIITDKDEDVATLEEKGIQFWIVDVRSQKFMVFENQTENYFGIREVIEEALQNEKNIPQVRKAGDYVHVKMLPFVTAIIILINAAVFLFCEIKGSTEDVAFMIDMGALGYDFIYEKHEFYRFITSTFLHFGFLHIVNNMFMLAIVGNCVEQWLGHIRFILVYFISGLGGGIASVIYHMIVGEAVVSAGASGAIYGIIGAMLVMLIKNQEEEIDIRQIFIVLILLIYGSMQEEVDFAAHVGGLIIGIISAAALSLREEKPK